jgi:hypothetical protein
VHWTCERAVFTPEFARRGGKRGFHAAIIQDLTYLTSDAFIVVPVKEKTDKLVDVFAKEHIGEERSV